MKMEHVALNVKDPVAMAAWYERYLGLKVVRKLDKHPFTHFLADDGATMLMEIYNNPPDAVPPYATMDPLLLHLAFATSDPAADKAALIAAGAKAVDETKLPDGSLVIMLRDPWGLAIQLCWRTKPMLGGDRCSSSGRRTARGLRRGVAPACILRNSKSGL